MADDTIYRQAALEVLNRLAREKFSLRDEFQYYLNALIDAEDEIKALPFAQRTGRWKVSDLPKGKMKYCSECGFGQYIADERRYGFCPNCGARMEEQE